MLETLKTQQQQQQQKQNMKFLRPNKWSQWKFKVERLATFLYISSELCEKEMKKTIPIAITIATKRKKFYWGINLTEEVKDLNVGN